MNRTKSAAACYRHLPKYLRDMIPVPDGKSAGSLDVRVTRLTEIDETYKCGCGVPAEWYVRAGKPER
ncbi:hypothetical protein [Nocardioides sp.]|uniref:hypothetical protein n=1 Tax=Nocardioides sp. TaxID=35761 RepID=UPI0039E37119